MKHTRLALSLLLLLTLVLPVSAARQSAAAVMDAMRADIIKMPAAQAVFTIDGSEAKVQGSAVISGARFTFRTPDVEVWYDGRTQWTYLASTGEVSITEPSAEELAMANPFAILTDYTRYYTIRRLTDSNGRARVELTPKAKGTGIEAVVVIADNNGKRPQAISIRLADGKRIDLVIDSISTLKKPTDAFFRYDAKKRPASEIIDLR